ncbi:MAG: DUF4340 domain-containing protein [Spirochaetaceae bacterium]|jgi:hypothetical protein|nr:DUF4340 domain-containing protein [Spirochaetaceae bacterium]
MQSKNQFKNKLTALCAVCGVLLLIYILSFVLSAENSQMRSSAWTILSEKSSVLAGKIEIKGNESIVLKKNGDAWFVEQQGILYPARQEKISEFLADLSAKGSYALRASSGNAFKNFGLDAASAKRIIINGQDDGILLDLLLGNTDSERNIYVARNGENEARLGKDIFSAYLGGSVTTWEDLRFFPNLREQKLSAASIQRVIVYQDKPAVFADKDLLLTYDAENTEAEAENEGEKLEPKADWTLERSNDGWKFADSSAADKSKAEIYVQGILDSSGESFSSEIKTDDPAFIKEGKVPGRIILEAGDGSRYTITLGPKSGERRTALVSGVDYVFTLADWTINRLWKYKNELSSEN